MLRTLILGFAVSACGTSSKDDGSETAGDVGGADAPTWHADVRPLVESSCANCHTEGGIGSFSLQTYEDVALIKDAVADAVADRRMPPWKAVDGCTDYRDDISLTDEEIAMVVEWVDLGAPEGSIEDSRSGSPPEAGGLERVDLSVQLPLAYDVDTTGTDDYRCFPVEWPVEEEVFVTGYVVNADRVDLLHHVIAYIIPGSYRDQLTSLEAEDGQAGYECFGGPGPISQADAAWLGAWAPGAVQGLLPNGIGIRMNPDDLLVLQMHYNSKSGATGSDQSSIDFTIESSVEREGWIQPFTNPAWVFAGGMDIPAQTEGAQQSFENTMTRNLTMHSANLHMHTLGRTARMEVERADGEKDCLLEIDDWDFDWQRTYAFSEPKTISPGDTWRIECSWDNPTDQDVDWGDGTGDEMCLGTVLMTLD